MAVAHPSDADEKENAADVAKDGEAEIVTGPSGEPVQSALFLCQQKTCSKTGKMTLERWSGWVHKERAFCLVPKEFGKTDAQQSVMAILKLAETCLGAKTLTLYMERPDAVSTQRYISAVRYLMYAGFRTTDVQDTLQHIGLKLDHLPAKGMALKYIF